MAERACAVRFYVVPAHELPVTRAGRTLRVRALITRRRGTHDQKRSSFLWKYLPAVALHSAVAATQILGQSPTVDRSRDAQCTVVFVPDPVGESDIARISEIGGYTINKPRLIQTAGLDITEMQCGTRVPSAIQRSFELGTFTFLRHFAILPSQLLTNFNSAYPRDKDNGALWAGRGVSAALSAGVGFRAGPVSGAIAPSAVYHANGTFQTAAVSYPGVSPYANPFYRTIDLPQRFGDTSYGSVTPGQSYIRVEAFNVAAGASTENFRWGTAIRNPLLLSFTAAGFPHAFIGTVRPLNVGIGRLETQLMWGRLTESEYFDGDPNNNHRMISGFVMNFEPSFLRGLFLGVSQLYEFTIPPEGISLADLSRGIVILPTSTLGENKPGNALAAFVARWVLPESKFEVYAEWGRDDYAGSLEDFLKEPDHSQAYTLGFQKVVARGDALVRIGGELTHLQAANPARAGRGVVVFYTHDPVMQGHTERGQMLGAPIGPSSDAQYLTADLFTGAGNLGVFAERVRYNDDAYYGTAARFFGANGHDVEVTGGLRLGAQFNKLRLSTETTFSHRYDRFFIGLDPGSELPTENNWGVRIALTWAPSRTVTAPERRAP